MSMYQQQRARRAGKTQVPPFQAHIISKDQDWIEKLEFLTRVLKCTPQELFIDLVQINYRNVLAGIKREREEGEEGEEGEEREKQEEWEEQEQGATPGQGVTEETAVGTGPGGTT